jgi:hypothetical protein
VRRTTHSPIKLFVNISHLFSMNTIIEFYSSIFSSL